MKPFSPCFVLQTQIFAFSFMSLCFLQFYQKAKKEKNKTPNDAEGHN